MVKAKTKWTKLLLTFIHTLIAKRLVDVSRDQKAGSFFAQRISIAIQRGNAASLLDTLQALDKGGEEFYEI
jgi:hypothetical protein